jgi:ABC-2 type transport system permease protein
MGKLWVVFQREYLERVRSKWFLFGTLLGPVFFLVTFLLPQYIGGGRNGASEDVAHVLVLDATGAGMGARVAEALGETFPRSPAPMVEATPASELPLAEDRAALQVQRSAVLGYLVLDSATVAGRSARYLGRNASSPRDVEALRAVVRQQVLAARMEQAGIDPQQVAAFTRLRLEMRTQKIGDNGREKGSGTGAMIFGFAVAMLLYMMIVIYGQTIMRGVTDEKTTRVAEVVVSSVSTDTLLAGKILGVGLVAITQVVSWIVLSMAAMYYVLPALQLNMGTPEQMAASRAAAQGADVSSAITSAIPSIAFWPGVALLCFFVLGFVLYASLFAAVGAMVNSQEDIQQAATPVMLLLVSSALFISPIMANPGSALARTMSMIPFSAPILMPLRMTLVPVPWWEVVGSIAGVTAACGAAIWLSARIYRVGLLMYGKKPSIRELARWVRYAR